MLSSEPPRMAQRARDLVDEVYPKLLGYIIPLTRGLAQYRDRATEVVLRLFIIIGPVCWLLSLGMFCDVAYLASSLFAGLLLNASRELRLRRGMEASLVDMRVENQKLAGFNTDLEANVTNLEKTSASLQSDLTSTYFRALDP